MIQQTYKRTGKIWKKADMWSAGVILFMMVTGEPPFYGDSDEEIFRRIVRFKFTFPPRHEGEPPISESVKDLIRKLLVDIPTRRLTAEDALKHPWISGDQAPDVPLPPRCRERLSQIHTHMRLKVALGRLLSQQLVSDDEKKEVDLVFKKFDKNGDGRLERDELEALMRYLGTDPRQAGVLLEKYGEGKALEPSQLVVASAASKVGELSQDDMKALFNKFDEDGDGQISAGEVEKVLGLGQEAIQRLITEADESKDGNLSFDEWLHALRVISKPMLPPGPPLLIPSSSLSLEREPTSVSTPSLAPVLIASLSVSSASSASRGSAPVTPVSVSPVVTPAPGAPHAAPAAPAAASHAAGSSPVKQRV
jgi:calcium-dependent protein kinase